MNKIDYFMHNFYGYLAGWLIYRKLLFVSAYPLNEVNSVILLFYLSLFIAGTGYSAQKKTVNIMFCTLTNVLLTFGIYAAFSFYFEMSDLIDMVLKFLKIFIIAYACIVFLRRIKSEDQVGVLRSRFKTFVKGTRTVGAAAMTIPLFIALLSADNFMNENEEYRSLSSEEYVYENIDLLKTLVNGEWDGLSKKEKTEVMQLLADTEAIKLGIPYKIHVRVDKLSYSGELGFYTNLFHTITVSSEHIYDSPSGVMNTVCHECYHAYQSCLVELYEDSSVRYNELSFFRKALKYKTEFDDYISAEDDFNAYYSQLCESDARDYAASEAYRDYIMIRSYLDDSKGQANSEKRISGCEV